MTQSNLSAGEKLQSISALLKAADRYVLEGDFDKAEEQVDKVFQIDPNNIYAKAYIKRIEVFKGKKGEYTQPGPKSEKQEETPQTEERPEPQEETQPPIEAESPEAQTTDELSEFSINENDTVGDTNVEDSDPREEEPLEHPQVKRGESEEKLTVEEQRKIVEEIVSKEADLLEGQQVQPQGASSQGNSEKKDPEILKQEENEQKYRSALESLWKEGRVSDTDQKKLSELRRALGITEERHAEIERSVKLGAYVNAVKEAWQNGLITPRSAAALEDLREQYSISIDEHLMIESRIMYELHGVRVKGVVMLIDDDVELTKIIKSILREEGYAPFAAHTPEHGLEILTRTVPDLILLDVTFPKPSMSGFSTYEQIRKRKNLRFVPVVFLSGLDEEHIVQVGKKLGADDYITKPCSEQLLVSTIEGKIKRYKEMRKLIEGKE